MNSCGRKVGADSASSDDLDLFAAHASGEGCDALISNVFLAVIRPQSDFIQQPPLDPKGGVGCIELGEIERRRRWICSLFDQAVKFLESSWRVRNWRSADIFQGSWCR
jgi:hypothetical protein